MKILKVLGLLLFVNSICKAQVVSDRLGFISSTSILEDNGFQIEAGHTYNGTNYSLLNLSSATGVVLRKGVNNMLEVQIRLPEYYTDGVNPTTGLTSVMAKIGFARTAKVKCSVLGGVGIAAFSGGVGLYMGMSIPAQLELTQALRLRAEPSFNLLILPSRESAGISLAIQQDIKDAAKMEVGVNSRFILIQRKEFGKERIFSEVLYGTLATQVNLTKFIALDAAVQLPLAIGENQPAIGNGMVIKGGLVISFAGKPWREKKVKIEPEVY